MKSIVEIFEKKGWALYASKKEFQNDLDKIILAGKATELVIGQHYIILPLCFRDSDPNEIWNHIDFLRSVKKSPKYRLKDELLEIEGLILEPNAIHLFPTKYKNHNIEINIENIDESLKYDFLNNNIFYFPSIEKLIEVIGLPPQRKSLLDGQLRYEIVMDEKDGKISAFPSEPNDLLYRGQVKRYQPCYPSMLREKNPGKAIKMSELPLESKLSIIEDLVKAFWFMDVLEETPQFKWAN